MHIFMLSPLPLKVHNLLHCTACLKNEILFLGESLELSPNDVSIKYHIALQRRMASSKLLCACRMVLLYSEVYGCVLYE